jgi:WD40 repeat protein
VCAFTVGDQTLLASGHSDDTVRIWDPVTGEQHHTFEGRSGQARAICAVVLDGRIFLAAAGGYGAGTVRMWDPVTGEQHGVLEGHTGKIHGACAAALSGRTLLVTASDDRTVRVWDPATGSALLIIPVHHAAQAVHSAGSTLFVGLDTGILAIDLDPALVTTRPL